MIDQLYQDRIVSLAKAKTGAGKLTAPTKSARRDNPLCGDRVVIDVKLDVMAKPWSFVASGIRRTNESAALACSL